MEGHEMKKRTVSLLLTAVLLLGALAVPNKAFAAGTLTLSSVSAARGETVEVAVSLTGDDVCSGNFNICYDADALELVSAVPAFSFAVVNETGPGVIRVSFAGMAVLTDTQLCLLTFRVTADTPADGSALTGENIRLYDENGILTTGSVISGSVGKDTVRLSLSGGDTAQYQAVGVDVKLSGALNCAGGNFTVTYDPDCFEAKSVLAGNGASGVSFTYNVVTPGTLRVAFSSADPIPACTLCHVIFQTVTGTEQDSAVSLSNARVYDENSKPLDVTRLNSTVSVSAPTDRDPKLWITGGMLSEDGSAEVAVVFQGRGAAYGGNFTLVFDEDLTVEVTSGAASYSAGNGTLSVSWGSATPYTGETTLLTVRFGNAKAGDEIGFDHVRVYNADSKNIPADIRPASLQKAESVIAVIDEERTSTETENGQTTYSVAVDVASAALGSAAVESVDPVLALYNESGKLVALAAPETVSLTGGVGEMTLSAETSETVGAARVFLLDGGGYVPLCTALESDGA